MEHICFNADLYCAIARVAPRWTRMSSQYASLVYALSYGSNKQVCAPSHCVNSNCRLYFCLKDEKKGKNYPRTPQSLQSYWKDSSFYVMVMCFNKSAISLLVLKGEKFGFSLTIFGLLLLLSIVFFFCHFPVIIVQILSFEQKLLLDIEYLFKQVMAWSMCLNGITK